MSRFRLVLLTGGMLSFGRAALAQCAVCTLSVAEIPNCAWGPYRSGAEGCDSDGINYCYVWGRAAAVLHGSPRQSSCSTGGSWRPDRRQGKSRG